MKYYSTFKREEILTHARTWMHLEKIKPNKISQTHMTNTILSHLYKISRRVKFIDRKKNGGYRVWVKEDEELEFNGYRVSILPDEEILEMDCTAMRIFLTLTCTVKKCLRW